MSNNSGLKFLFGLAVGTAVGATLAYFSDKERRNRFIENVSEKADRATDGIKDAYYEGRIRTRKIGRDLSRRWADFRSDASEVLHEAKETACSLGGKSKDTAKSIADHSQKQLENLRDEIRSEGAALAKNIEAIRNKE